MNYRHIFHAGNFADLLKHAVLTALLAEMTTDHAPLIVIDSHAGAGVYDLSSDAAMMTGEAEAGIGMLMADGAAPAVFDALKSAVRALNVEGWRQYPGSPVLIARALRGRDRLIACETRREDFEVLRHALRAPGALALREDGWEAVRKRTPGPPARVLILIDPPYEAADDAEQTTAAVAQVLARNPSAVIAAWAPIKDLASLDNLIVGLEEAVGGRRLLVTQTRLRPLDDPLKLNGCIMAVANPPAGLEVHAGAAAVWIAAALGGAGGLGRAEFV